MSKFDPETMFEPKGEKTFKSEKRWDIFYKVVFILAVICIIDTLLGNPIINLFTQ